ncbi:hypothetical protein ALC62_08596, partial [Cyphomyrmex costatus]
VCTSSRLILLLSIMNERAWPSRCASLIQYSRRSLAARHRNFRKTPSEIILPFRTRVERAECVRAMRIPARWPSRRRRRATRVAHGWRKVGGAMQFSRSVNFPGEIILRKINVHAAVTQRVYASRLINPREKKTRGRESKSEMETGSARRGGRDTGGGSGGGRRTER